MPVSMPHTMPHYADLLLDAICLVDTSGHFVFASAACESIFGYTQEEMVGRNMFDMVHPDDRERTAEAARSVQSGQLQTRFENRYIRKDGRIVHIMWTARWSERDQMRIGVARDITESRYADAMREALYSISEAANSTEDLQVLFRSVHRIIHDRAPADDFSIALYDAAKDQLSFPYYASTDQPPQPRPLDTGSLSAQVIRRGESLLLTPDSGPAPAARHWYDLSPHALYCLAVPMKSSNGTVGALVLQSHSEQIRYTQADMDLLQFVATQVVAAMERIQSQARYRHMALYDQLTGLPNRELLHDRLQLGLERALRQKQPLALLYIDLDKFKQVNDTLGHSAGDRLLKIAADRLAGSVRASDTVARIGGDEFAVLLEGAESREQAMAVAGKILDTLSLPVEINGQTPLILASIGIALYPDHGGNAQQLFDYADAQMYAAKKRPPRPGATSTRLTAASQPDCKAQP